MQTALDHHCKKHGLTTSDVARAIGKPWTVVDRHRRGVREPTLEYVRLYNLRLGIPLRKLVRLVGKGPGS